MKEKPRIQLNLPIDLPTRTALADLAIARGKSRAEIVRELIRREALELYRACREPAKDDPRGS